MSLRDQLNERPALITGITAGILLLAMVLIGYQIWPRGEGSGGSGSGVYFTTDAGTTWTQGSAADTYTPGPDGKPRVRARLFVWEDGGEPFVAYLERPTAEAIKRRQQGSGAGATASGRPEVLDFEVARKGENKWHKATSPEGQEITRPPRREDGTAAVPY